MSLQHLENRETQSKRAALWHRCRTVCRVRRQWWGLYNYHNPKFLEGRNFDRCHPDFVCLKPNDTCGTCDGGYHYNSSSMTCVVNTCTCSYGNEVVGASECTTNNAEICATENTMSFTFDALQLHYRGLPSLSSEDVCCEHLHMLVRKWSGGRLGVHDQQRWVLMFLGGPRIVWARRSWLRLGGPTIVWALRRAQMIVGPPKWDRIVEILETKYNYTNTIYYLNWILQDVFLLRRFLLTPVDLSNIGKPTSGQISKASFVSVNQSES